MPTKEQKERIAEALTIIGALAEEYGYDTFGTPWHPDLIDQAYCALKELYEEAYYEEKAYYEEMSL
jgi:hypothetical protein